MLDIKFIRNYPDKVKENCKQKHIKVDVDLLLEVDKKRRQTLQALEDMLAQKNQASKIISRTKDEKEKRKLILEMRELDKNSDRLTKTLKELEGEFNNLMLQIPNSPLADVPIGRDERDNVVLREWGVFPPKPKFDFKPKNYLELAENLDLIDVKRAAKISGTRFGILKREAALLKFALRDLTFDILMKDYNPPTTSSRSSFDERAPGFIPLDLPVMIKPEMMQGMGYVERGEEEIYYLRDDNLCLVGTAEQSIGPMHANEIFEEKDLPKRYFAFTPCFRREAGSYGKDTKGIFRVHQFDKIEMFSFSHPEKSREEHQFFLKMEEKLIQALKIPYRVVQMCTGDLGDPAASKYDIEAWLPSENRYRETHSTSNCTDFQARRLNIRYRAKTGKLNFVHTVNGTAFAIGRTLIAIIENYQQKDGSIKVPEVLQKYLQFKEIKK
ncbi:MAG: serine--tRNA ligase [Parcubacteria group bacterium CG2_30_36_18]|uniref:Serine--tRNA ligase n=1 Tax=Candidatus Nealsonbacteria bacterium CG_4_9_14_0_8_um_filter_36_17 TaxID=1974693 RepID=A0A2M8DLJ1_9BACT|nr:MAG: serine--tRNA ligase [Parcubacteria group bacterium CG2_30_36_18]PJB98660.1 MAG: serine--tRNA ligase [Candidatus Nealsonbacteria bacterium CG_4_9_14_0_8_um_filter_36_17]